MGEASGQSTAVESWLNELHSESVDPDNAKKVAEDLGPILRDVASGYAHGKRDIYDLQAKYETAFLKAFAHAKNDAEGIKKKCSDSAEFDTFEASEKWSNTYFDEVDKIVEDILRDWKPPH